jgi:hypothetical protein
VDVVRALLPDDTIYCQGSESDHLLSDRNREEGTNFLIFYNKVLHYRREDISKVRAVK